MMQLNDTLRTDASITIVHCIYRHLYRPEEMNDTRWFKYDRDICGLFTQKSVLVIFEPPCTCTRM